MGFFASLGKLHLNFYVNGLAVSLGYVAALIAYIIAYNLSLNGNHDDALQTVEITAATHASFMIILVFLSARGAAADQPAAEQN